MTRTFTRPTVAEVIARLNALTDPALIGQVCYGPYSPSPERNRLARYLQDACVDGALTVHIGFAPRRGAKPPVTVYRGEELVARVTGPLQDWTITEYRSNGR